jgi:hypothetical protein
MYRDFRYPKWAEAENMERIVSLRELQCYSEPAKIPIYRKCMVRRKIANMLYRLADSICAKCEWDGTWEKAGQKKNGICANDS